MASDSGTYTPETIARRLKIAEAMLGDAPPVQHWAQGLNELAKGYVGGNIFRNAEDAERQGISAQQAAIASLLTGGSPGAPGGGTGVPAPVAASPTGPSPTPPPALPPDSSPIVPNKVPTISMPPVQQATEGLSPTDQAMADARTQLAAGLRNKFGPTGAGAPMAGAGPPPQAALPPAAPPALPVPTGAPPAAAMPAPGPTAAAAPTAATGVLPGGNTDAKARIAAMLTDPNPYVRRQGAQLATSMLPSLLKKDQFVPVAGPGGVLMQKNTETGELKAHPAAQEYNVQKLQDGTMVAINKNNPNDYHVLNPGTRENLIRFAGARKEAETEGEGRGKATFDLPGAIEKSQFLLKSIDDLEKHPGLSVGTGMTGLAARRIPGTKGYDFGVAAQQVQGKTFLEAYSGLRGAGAITEKEGEAATAAIARLNTAQSEDAYRTALKDLKVVVQSGVNRLKLQTGKTPEEIQNIQRQVGPNAANTGGAGGVRRYNPATGTIE